MSVDRPSFEVRLSEAVEYVRHQTDAQPRIALILGSGLGEFASRINAKASIDAIRIPHYPTSSVQGHAGKLIFGNLRSEQRQSTDILVFKGRVHFYETGDIVEAVFPVHVASKLGVEILIVTNAAGGINRLFHAGDLMLIRDYINLTGLSPIPYGNHTKQSNGSMKTHTGTVGDVIVQTAARLGVPLREGTYCWLKGPSYETRSEIEMLRILGADAVGMSTAPEMIVADRLGLRTGGISLISNLATGISGAKLSHEEVTETAGRIQQPFSRLLEETIWNLSAEQTAGGALNLSSRILL